MWARNSFRFFFCSSALAIASKSFIDLSRPFCASSHLALAFFISSRLKIEATMVAVAAWLSISRVRPPTVMALAGISWCVMPNSAPCAMFRPKAPMPTSAPVISSIRPNPTSRRARIFN